MPVKRNHSKKGRLSGTACKELNANASSKMIERTVVGTNNDTVFARVTRMLGFGHVRVLIPTTNGTREMDARIPHNKFGKRGATPITMSSVVAIFVGADFDPTIKARGTEHFDITAILSDRQVRELVLNKFIPSWMLKTADEITSGSLEQVDEEEGFDWDISEMDHTPNAMTKSELRAKNKAADDSDIGISNTMTSLTIDDDVIDRI